MIDYSQLEVGIGSGELSVANVVLTTACNAQCDGCAYWRLEPEHLPLETFKQFIDHVNEEDPRGVLLTGGDPLLHPEIDEIIEYLIERELPIIVNTQAWSLHKLSDRQLNKIDSFVISFDSFREEVYHEIRKGPLQIVEEAVNRIQSVSPETHLTANILAQKRNVDHFEATVRYTYNQLEMDSASLLVPSVEPQGFGWEYEDEDGEPPIGVLELEEIRRLEDQYYNILSDDNLRSFISQPANALADYVEYLKMLAGYDGELSKRGCFVPEETITLTPHGDFKTCFYLSDRFEWEDHEVPPSQLEERQSFLEEYEETQPETCEYCMQFACNERLRPVVQWTASNPA